MSGVDLNDRELVRTPLCVDLDRPAQISHVGFARFLLVSGTRHNPEGPTSVHVEFKVEPRGFWRRKIKYIWRDAANVFSLLSERRRCCHRFKRWAKI